MTSPGVSNFIVAMIVTLFVPFVAMIVTLFVRSVSRELIFSML